MYITTFNCLLFRRDMFKSTIHCVSQSLDRRTENWKGGRCSWEKFYSMQPIGRSLGKHNFFFVESWLVLIVSIIRQRVEIHLRWLKFWYLLIDLDKRNKIVLCDFSLRQIFTREKTISFPGLARRAQWQDGRAVSDKMTTRVVGAAPRTKGKSNYRPEIFGLE